MDASHIPIDLVQIAARNKKNRVKPCQYLRQCRKAHALALFKWNGLCYAHLSISERTASCAQCLMRGKTELLQVKSTLDDDFIIL